MQVLYNEIMNRLDKIEFAPPKEVYDSPKMKITGDEYPKIKEAQIALKSFQQYAVQIAGLSFADEKEDCMREIMTADHLSDKEREKLITALKF